jgi:primosomal protein N' (replication factor Y)
VGAHRAGRGVPCGGRGDRLSQPSAPGGGAAGPHGLGVCRVVPDVAAIDRVFDYLVPEALAAEVAIGTLVRVPLHGRRVRGWVVALDVEPATTPDRLVPLTAVVSAGPPAEVVELCAWAAWRWAGPWATFLRAASAPNAVTPGPATVPDAAVYPPTPGPLPLPEVDRLVVRWPPAADRSGLIASLAASEGSTIVVAPDPGDDTALTTALEDVGREVLTWRASSSAADRTRAWAGARRGACVIIGGRIAVLAPVPDLQAVVVLDDGDEALKEERAPTWHARDLGAERCARARARLTVVSPAPTVEALEPAVATVDAPDATRREGWPRLEIVDLRDEPPGAGLLSDRLGPAIHRAIDAGGRAVCVLNRKGRARLLACTTCRELARCARCDAAVAESAAGLVCPRCGEARPRVCLACNATRFRAVRPGVVRVREQLAGLVPRARVVAVEGGSAPVPAFDVAVGTEAVLHRVEPSGARPVRLVAFLDMDQELLAPRYRAAEQALWLLVRAVRLIGSRHDGGVVLVQTRLPTDGVLAAASSGDTAAVASEERTRRASLGFPPFGGLAELSGDAGAVAAACDALRDSLTILGPDGGRALLRAPSAAAVSDALAAADLTRARAVGRLRVDVEPLRI